jgi:CRP/FNR family transcriptional regulator
MPSIELLCTTPLFAGLTDAELETVARCLVRRTYGQGVYVFHQGGPGRRLYLIESGKVRCFVTDYEGRQITLDILGPGQVFGPLGAHDDLPRAFSVQIVERAVVRSLERQDLLLLLDRTPRLRRNLDRWLTARLRAILIYFQDLAFRDVKGRVAARLLILADRFGLSDDGEGGETVWFPDQQELANWAATSRESVNRVLGALRDEGLIRVESCGITILDRHGLENHVQTLWM